MRDYEDHHNDIEREADMVIDLDRREILALLKDVQDDSGSAALEKVPGYARPRPVDATELHDAATSFARRRTIWLID